MGDNLRYLEEQLVHLSSQIDEIRNDISDIKHKIVTQSRSNAAMPLILKPSNCPGGLNVARFLRERIGQLNSSLPDHKKYHQFPEDISDTALNRTCKGLLERWMKAEFKDAYGSMTWSQACSGGYFIQCDSILSKAERHISFKVFKQTVGSWAIIHLASQKLRSAVSARSSEAATNTEVENNEAGQASTLDSPTTEQQEQMQPSNNQIVSVHENEISPVPSRRRNRSTPSNMRNASSITRPATGGINRRRYLTRSSRIINHGRGS